MHALGQVLAADADRSAMGDFWYQPAYRSGAVGGPIDPESAMTIPQFYAAVTYVAEDIGKLPLNISEDLGTGGSQPAPDHELQERLHDQPNQYQDAIEWKEMATAWAMLRGKAVNEIIAGAPISYPGAPTRKTAVDQLVPLHPDLVREETNANGVRRIKYRDPKLGGDERTLLLEDVFVVRGRQSRSVLDFAATNLSTTIAMERYAGFMFSRGAKHQGVIQAKGKLADTTRVGLRKALDEYAIGGPRAGRPLLLEDGMEWKDVSMTVQDAQLVEQKLISIADACRWIRIPPHKVFDLSRSTNNNISSQGVDYVVDCLLAWAVRWEQAIWRDLMVDKHFYAKLNLDALLRGDIESRSRAYALAIMWGWMTRNEVRSKEGYNPIPGLEKPLTPENMTTSTSGDSATTTVGYAPQALLGDGKPLDTEGAGLIRLFASDAAARAVRRETNAVAKLAERVAGDRAAFRVGLEAFYAEHAETIARDLHIPRHEALRYAKAQQASLLARGPDAMDDWPVEGVARLTELAMDKPEVLAA
jgi:HK97 family phage portal protein